MISFHRNADENSFLLSIYDSASELACKQRVSWYVRVSSSVLGVKKYSEDTDACQFI